MLYRFGRFVFVVLFKLFYRWRIEGKENIPADGPLIICSNHISWLDPFAVGSAVPARLRVHFMAKNELFQNWFVAFLLNKVGAFPVNRSVADYGAIRRSYQLLKEGKVLSLFPEGTRSKSGRLQKAQHGTALIAGRHPVPILPVAIVGPYRPCRPLQINIGPPFSLPLLDFNGRQEKKEMLDQMSAVIMGQIKKLFPGGVDSDNNTPE
ncbi:MAG: lysophospholipid acyltransferase family protein [Bacillota bacterium]